MAMNRKVFLSILAMDSYQRGYAPGIKDVTDNKIGAATIGRDSSVLVDESGKRLDQPIGFFAQSYTWGADTVISYRGTDFDAANGGKILNSEFIKDFYAGWSTFAGLGDRSQFRLAEQFFTSVTGGQFYDGVTYNNVIVTGHSLGGGLAGYVDAAVDVKSYLVDPIPYGVTAWLNAISDAFAATLVEFGNLTLADLETLDEVNSTDDSRFRVEILTREAPRQWRAANDNRRNEWRGATFRLSDERAAA